MQNKYTVCVVAFVVGLAVASLTIAQGDGTQPANDPVLAFYWKSADASLASRDPLQHGVKYSFLATTYYKQIGKNGKVESTDSSRTKFSYSFGNLDSSRSLVASRHKMPEAVLEYPNVFHDQYVLTDFPNDTGGQMLAVGFDTDSSATQKPTGLAVIDRQLYYPHWLYLYYPHKQGYRRFTRSYRFTLRDGFIFPDSVWEVATRIQLFLTTTYRLETRIDSLTVYR